MQGFVPKLLNMYFFETPLMEVQINDWSKGVSTNSIEIFAKQSNIPILRIIKHSIMGFVKNIF